MNQRSLGSGQDQYVLKDIPQDILSSFNEKIQPQFYESPYIRLPSDSIPGQRILAYKYLTNNFLSLGRKQIPLRSRNMILPDCLQGIADLHDRQVIYFGNLALG